MYRGRGNIRIFRVPFLQSFGVFMMVELRMIRINSIGRHDHDAIDT
ncbi:hypothetical protein CP8484711_1726 [Chlamydia psittaci 84-8471/1]|nr:hypothetical protein CP8484711_1726 [Chlamydia psittaci 84-8471/1]